MGRGFKPTKRCVLCHGSGHRAGDPCPCVCRAAFRAAIRYFSAKPPGGEYTRARLRRIVRLVVGIFGALTPLQRGIFQEYFIQGKDPYDIGGIFRGDFWHQISRIELAAGQALLNMEAQL